MHISAQDVPVNLLVVGRAGGGRLCRGHCWHDGGEFRLFLRRQGGVCPGLVASHDLVGGHAASFLVLQWCDCDFGLLLLLM